LEESIWLLYKDRVIDLTEATVAKFIKKILNAVPAEDVVEVRYARGIGPLVIRK
jgi:hypothetical protein